MKRLYNKIMFTVHSIRDPFNPLNPKGFCVFERFSAFTRPMGLRDSIFKVTIESAAVLKH